MAIYSDLDIRMKNYYEFIPKTKLMRRTPVAVRLDGKAFHTFTRGFQKPFDEVLALSMQDTMKYLCENIQGCVIGYTQSDEITLILVDYRKLNTDAWFDYEVQKMCSISASMATMAFNKAFLKRVEEFSQCNSGSIVKGDLGKTNKELEKYVDVLNRACNRGVMFDSRCFNIPKEEVANLLFWRQDDASKNSVQMVAQANFSHKELQGLSVKKLQDKLSIEKGINWNDYPTMYKRGSCCIKKDMEVIGRNGEIITRKKWVIDNEIPIFKGEGRDYIEKFIYVGE